MTAEQIAAAKLWLRISTDALDEEIGQTVDACLLDLHNAGVVNTPWDDALIKQAVKLYCKAQFGYNADSDKFAKSYEYLKCALALSGDYSSDATKKA
nr:MAG TPA: head to tail adaptor [Caudoviricetes sp.]